MTALQEILTRILKLAGCEKKIRPSEQGADALKNTDKSDQERILFMADKNEIKEIETDDAEIREEDTHEEDTHDSETSENKEPAPDIPEKSSEAEFEEARNQAKENYDRFLRVSAEFENYKKRSARETELFKKFANESLIKEMLPVVDNLERAIDSSTNNGDMNGQGILEGVKMTLEEILKIIEKFGVMPIEALGKTFDPSFHEAVMQQESEEAPDNTVLTEFQKGYMLHDRLLRPAMVVVSKAKASSENEDN